MSKGDDSYLNKFFKGQNGPDPDPTGTLTVAIMHKNLFDAYINEGFTRSEALQLTCTFITSSAMVPMVPDD